MHVKIVKWCIYFLLPYMVQCPESMVRTVPNTGGWTYGGVVKNWLGLNRSPKVNPYFEARPMKKKVSYDLVPQVSDDGGRSMKIKLTKKQKTLDFNAGPLNEIFGDFEFDQSGKPLRSMGTNGYQKIFIQKLDHFKYDDTKTWEQRYYVYTENQLMDNIVYVLIGGHMEMKPEYFESGVWNEFTKETGALLVCLEHRYYGGSRPTYDLGTDNLIYLNSEQALADLASFISEIRNNKLYGINTAQITKWVAIGTSQGGALAAQLRLKFPNLIDAAVSTVAPLLARSDFKEYFEEIDNELNKYPDAKKTIQQAYESIQKYINKVDPNRADSISRILYLHKQLNLCTNQPITNFTSLDDVRFLFWSMSTLLGQVVQSGKFDNETIKHQVFEKLKNKFQINPLKRFGDAFRKILKHFKLECLPVDYSDVVYAYQKNYWGAEVELSYVLSSGIGNRQKLYQRCTQLGLFEVSEQKNRVFGNKVPLKFYVKLCTDVFGDEFDLLNLDEGVFTTNAFYGGLDIEVTNVIFVTLGQDLWYEQCVTSCSENKRDCHALHVNEPDPNTAVITNQDKSDQWKKEWNEVIHTLNMMLEIREVKFDSNFNIINEI